ncbi:MAG: OmpA family protein [Chitinophagaceae bacterium]
MKKFLCSLLAIGLLSANAQDNDYKKSPSLILNLTAFDFKTAQAIRSSSLSTVLTEKKWSKLGQMNLGFGLSYLKGLCSHIDLMASINGAFVKYPFRDKVPYTNDGLLLEADAVANIKLLTDQHVVSPYLSAGIGASRFENVYGAYIPVGAGIQVKLFDETFLLTNIQYRIPVTQEANYHLVYSIGFGSALSERKPEMAKPLPMIPVVEKAPPPVMEVVKPKDSDNDGVPDDVDKCPTIPGVAKYNGCPIPDSDKDGINDEEDKCPNQPGLARYQGCPIPDTDGDGVNDEQDKCPTEAGPATNGGCPVKVKEKRVITEEVKAKVEMAAKRVFFQTNKSTLLSKSFPSLEEVIAILKENEDAKLDIEGHTDNTGSDKINQPLSQNRANAVMKYFVKNGIDASRLTAKGFGSSKPRATNKTAAGRAENRRVVMTLAD